MNSVGKQAASQSMQSRLVVRFTLQEQMAVLLFQLDSMGKRNPQSSLGSLHRQRRSLRLHGDSRGQSNYLSAYSRHSSITFRLSIRGLGDLAPTFLLAHSLRTIGPAT